MHKKRINLQQQLRIEKKQKTLYKHENHHRGLVISRFSAQAVVESSEKHLILCSIRSNIDSIVAGDSVIWQKEGNDQGVILSCCPRTSVLGRLHQKGKIKAIAANLNQVIIVIAPKPAVSWPLLDSYLVMCEHLQLKACILLNKTDLPCQEETKYLMQQYQILNYPILYTSTKEQGKNSDRILQETLENHVSVFVGQSGVGKSSLIARLLPHENKIATAAISEYSELGKHTTSNSYYYHIPTGGAIIDSPGIREFSLWHMAPAEIALGFREFHPYLHQCKYKNCEHHNTQGCAIIHAVQEGNISAQRYNNFLNIVMKLAHW